MNAAAIRLLIAKGLDASDIAEVAEALERKRDATGAERQARHRAKMRGDRNAVTVTRDPPIEEIITPGVPPSSANADDVPPFDEKIVSVWNEAQRHCDFTEARPLNAERKRKLKLRLREHGEAALLDAIARLAASPFHCGHGSRGWKVHIGWLLQSTENVTKALELPPPANGKAAVDPLEAAERSAALYRRMGRDDDAAEAERRAERLRTSATGPPRSIGQIVRGLSAAAQ